MAQPNGLSSSGGPFSGTPGSPTARSIRLLRVRTQEWAFLIHLTFTTRDPFPHSLVWVITFHCSHRKQGSIRSKREKINKRGAGDKERYRGQACGEGVRVGELVTSAGKSRSFFSTCSLSNKVGSRETSFGFFASLFALLLSSHLGPIIRDLQRAVFFLLRYFSLATEELRRDNEGGVRSPGAAFELSLSLLVAFLCPFPPHGVPFNGPVMDH